jgi:hypothetical protein
MTLTLIFAIGLATASVLLFAAMSAVSLVGLPR